MSEKTEKPTAYKLQKAREKGQVSKSNELAVFLFFLIMLSVITLIWPNLLNELKFLLRHLLYLATQISLDYNHVTHLHRLIIKKILDMGLLIGLTALLAAIFSHSIQTGFVWSVSAIQFNFNRLNISLGFKKICSSKTLYEAIKNIIKMVTVCLMLFPFAMHYIPNLIHLLLSTSKPSPELMMSFIQKTLFQIIVVLGLFSGIDVVYTRWKYTKDHKMSKQELKDEYKQKEGDPKIKAKIRQIQNQLRQKTASLNQVKNADVVITNPTHLAIALSYKRNEMPAPKVICKAQNEMAIQVKSLARKHHIPVIEHKIFARALFHTVELNHWISRDLFPAAAQIFRELYQHRKEN